jgi:hypothetical protein
MSIGTIIVRVMHEDLSTTFIPLAHMNERSNLQELGSSKHPQKSADQTPLAGGGYEAAMCKRSETMS